MKVAGHIILRLSFLFLFLTGVVKVSAQYYDWGQDPASLKWRQVNTGYGKTIYPADYEAQARRLTQYRETLMPHVSYGFSEGALDIPILIHTRNFSPNGLVMLAPNRVELLTIPPASTYATPWIKQLLAHEMRHTVQYKNLNRGVIGWLGKIFGQHGSAIGLAFMPLWAMEGDAVQAETELTAYGRALQPSFTIEYRAMMMEGTAENYPIDKFFSGSYVDFLPDHYQLGYQITSYAYTKYGENIWDKVTWYGTKRPYQLFTTHIALKKFYSTSSSKLLRETFADLTEYWGSLPLTDNSSHIIKTPITSYTRYATPVSAKDGAVYALKADLDRTNRIVRIDPESGDEHVLQRTGSVNTGLVLSGDRLWWSEYRMSHFWEQQINSEILFYDIGTGKSGKLRSSKTAMFPASTEDGKIAWVEYNYGGSYDICDTRNRIPLSDTISVHGLTYDEGNYYFIGLSDSGMWIGKADPETRQTEMVTEPGYSSMSDLRAAGGLLYYTSIASGKDEAHSFDISTGKEYRLTDSRYGSFGPSPGTDRGNVLVTTYTPEGYLPAVQPIEASSLNEISFSRMPMNTVNPARKGWDLPKIDDVRSSDTDTIRTGRYLKGTHLLQLHSWAPVWYEPNNLLGENNVNVHLGLTVLSQNLLNTAYTIFGYKYTDKGHFITGNFKYYGFPVKLEIGAEYGFMDKLVYVSSQFSPDEVDLSNLKLRNYFETTGKVFLPITFDGGYHVRRLTPIIEFEHLNAKIHYPDEDGGHFSDGIQKMKFSLQFTDNVRMSHRDFLPRWGYAARITHTSNMFNRNFGSLWSAYLRTYLPGIMAHHSLTVRSGLQHARQKTYNFRQKEVFPRGASYEFSPDRYASVSVDYQFPVWYPDGGINSLLYFKRVRANLYYDYARFRLRGKWDDVCSYGFDVTLDLVPIRLPASTNTSVTFSLRNPSDKKGVVFAMGFSMPI